ncbi:MAG: UDP-N-acetylmuramoyl-tripeptide--D-alanyl-D-alanine ligase [Gammaproteobacteria bacterium]|nr:UDP-N-acetylmuramoyl-tripeptide--D-alanyl-D-alanine ligase [Gammaproteobacteria bacterium]
MHNLTKIDREKLLMLWTSQELRSALNLKPISSRGRDICGVSIDSRTLSDGDLFVALKGDGGKRFPNSNSKARDGHQFIAAAEANGAAAIVCSKETECKLPTHLVEDTLDALWQLAEFARARMKGNVLAITGSAGKTTARTWLEQLLSSQGNTHASVASYNNHWGVPLSISRMPSDTSYGVFEVGMNHRGEIAPLSRLINPQVALVLNVLPAHIGQLGSLDAIRIEKLSISKGLVEGGTLVLPFDLDPTTVSKRIKILTFGLNEKADISGKIIKRDDPWIVQIKIDKKLFEFSLPFGGEHRVATALAAVAAVHAMGGDVGAALTEINTLKIPVGRGNLVTAAGRRIIDDSYNANVVSMQYAIDNLLQASTGKKIALLGEMRELGAHGVAMHREVLTSCTNLDAILTVGKGFRDSRMILGNKLVQHADSIHDIDLERLVDLTRPGDTILVKASNTIFWRHQIVDSLITAIKAN